MFNPPPPGPDMPSPAGHPQDTSQAEAVYNRASVLLRAGTPPPEVEQALVAEGLDPESAALVVSDLSGPQAQGGRRPRPIGSRSQPSPHHLQVTDAAFREILRAAGHKNMGIGGLVCVVGLVMTLGSLAAASGAGGGTYIVAWGAIVFGAIQFFRGISQVSQANR